MEWTELILNFVGQIAWPFVVLVLGLCFRKPLVKLLADSGPLKSLSAGPLNAQWAVEAGVAIAKDKTDFSPQERMEQEDTSVTDEAENSSSAPSEAPVAEPQEESTQHAPDPDMPALTLPERVVQGLDPDTVRRARENPAQSILDSARNLNYELLDVVRSIGVRGKYSRSLLQTMDQLQELGLLTDDEAEAGRELAIVRKRLAVSDGDLRVDPDTALDYARVCQRLLRSARTASDRRKARQRLDGISQPRLL